MGYIGTIAIFIYTAATIGLFYFILPGYKQAEIKEFIQNLSK